MGRKTKSQWQYGDFQTPIELARKVVDVLINNHHIRPDAIIEPTCGTGAFLRACSEQFKTAKIVGVDINSAYVAEAKSLLHGASHLNYMVIQEGNFFTTNWHDILTDLQGNLLLIGNPPWVTSSELSMLNSQNHPEKSNFQHRRGIEAITGSGNFDISEWMLLQHINWLSNRSGVMAFLCKYAVARKVMKQIRTNTHHPFSGHIYPVDAKAYFGASVEACLFVLIASEENADCQVYESLESTSSIQIIGERDGNLVNNVALYEKWQHLNGQDICYTWHTGIKHDCAKIMELYPQGDAFSNGIGETVNLEETYLFPLLKSSDIGNGRITNYRKKVLVTQKRVGDDTSKIQQTAPQTWNYLQNHKAYLKKRKSSIYRAGRIENEVEQPSLVPRGKTEVVEG
ncbi:MAG: N-6 DNA methylase, partial [Chloroflexota bacterium]